MRDAEAVNDAVDAILTRAWADLTRPERAPHCHGFPDEWGLDAIVQVDGGPPVSVQVLAEIAHNLPVTPALLTEVNAHNQVSQFVRFDVSDDGTVSASYRLLDAAVTSTTLMAAVDWIRYCAEMIGPILVHATDQP